MPAEQAAAAAVAPGLTHEDSDRSADRARVFSARHGRKRWHLLWLLVGPGVLAMIGENDGPSMISYATSGARYGIGFFLPFILVTFVGAVVVQEMAMRVGAVTHRGYGELVLQRFGRTWGWFSAGDLVATNLVTLITEFIAVRIGMSYFGLGAPYAVGLGLVLVVATLTGGRYWRWERVALGLAAFNLLFVAAALLARPDAGSAAHAVITWSPFPSDSSQAILLLVASNIGATVTPWMIFFQQSAVADKGMTPRDIRHGRYDTILGGGLAALCGCGALLAASVLHAHGGSALNGFSGAGLPAALRPVAGNAVGTVFALGLIEAGALAILTISAATAYAVGETVGSAHSFNAPLRSGLLFYACNIGAALLAAAIVLIPGAPLLSIALNANVLATVLLPVSLIFLIMLANDRALMGSRANRSASNAAAVTVAAVVALAGCAYSIDAFAHVV